MKLFRFKGRGFGVRSLLVAAIQLVALVHAHAQCQEWTSGFAGEGCDREVRALAVFDDGQGPALCAGGLFSIAGEASSPHVARWDGSRWSSLGSGMDNNVNALAVFDDGSGPALFAAGAFSFAGGSPVSFVARWNGTSWSALGPGVDDDVNALAVFDDGSGPALYAAGIFIHSGATQVDNIARWNGASWSPVGGGIAGQVAALAVHDDGSGPALYATGLFGAAGGVLTSNIARWNGTSWSAVGGGLGGAGHALAVFDDGSGPALHAGGSFTSVPGGSNVNHIARWNGTSWSAVGSGLSAATATVSALAVFDDGSGPALYAGGNFFTTLAGVQALHVARWNGSAWSAVGNSLHHSVSTGHVYALAVYDDGHGAKLHAGGDFTFSGATEVSYIASWSGAGWQPVGPDHGLSGEARDFVTFEAGSGPELVVGGSFTAVDGVGANNVARWNGTVWSSLGSGFNAPVEALAVYDGGSGAGPQLFAGGRFNSSLGGGPDYVARWDGTSWVSVGTGLNGIVFDFLVSSFGSSGGPVLYAVGTFSTAGGLAALRLARWNGASWSAVAPSGVGTVMFAIVEHDDGSSVGRALYVSSNAGQRIWRWNGANWSTVGTLNEIVFDFAVFDAGTGSGPLLCAADGYKMHVWNGSAWYVPAGPFQGTGIAMHVFDDASGAGPGLYVGGTIETISSNPVRHVLRWNGTSFTALGNGVDGTVLALGDYDEGTGQGPALFAGGRFQRAGDVGASSIARWQGCAITKFCAGDGADPLVSTPCPCGNFGARRHGCAWSGNTTGALIDVTGRIDPDSILLQASGMPLTSISIFLEGHASNGSGVIFGDGVRCVDGALIRLGTRPIVNGVAQYPDVGNLPVSVRGNTPPGSGLVGHYQTYYRDTAAFCTSAMFNVTNGVRILW